MADLPLSTTWPSPGPSSRSIEASKCPNCGNVYMPDASFCRHCGQKRDQVDALSLSRGTAAPRSLSASRRTLDLSTSGGGTGGCSGLYEATTSASTINAVVRDVKAVADAQARLVRVIEEVSQELTQRLAGHDAKLTELQQKLAESVAGQTGLRNDLQRLQAEEVARHGTVNSELTRLRGSDHEVVARLTHLEAKFASAEEERGHQNTRLPQKLQELRAQLHQELEQQRQQWEQRLMKDLERPQQQLQKSIKEQLQQQQRQFQELQQKFQQDSDKRHQELAARMESQEAALAPKVQQQLERSLLQQLSQQLSQQVQQLLQQQLEQQLQPQLQQQVQQHLEKHDSGVAAAHEQLRSEAARREEQIARQLQELRRVPSQIQQELAQRLEAHERSVAEGQEALQEEAVKREKHLSELQEAAQRLAKSATQRQAASEAEAMSALSASSSLAARMAQVEGELLGLQKQEKERQRRRIARLEEDLASPMILSPRTAGGEEALGSAAAMMSPEPREPRQRACSPLQSPVQRKEQKESKVPALSASIPTPDAGAVQPNFQRICDELRMQVLAELGETRRGAQQLGSRVTKCENEISELRSQVNNLGETTKATATGLAPPGVRRIRPSQGSPALPPQESSGRGTPDWPFSPSLGDDQVEAANDYSTGKPSANGIGAMGFAKASACPKCGQVFADDAGYCRMCGEQRQFVQAALVLRTNGGEEAERQGPPKEPTTLPPAPLAQAVSVATGLAPEGSPAPAPLIGLGQMRLQAQQWLAEESPTRQPNWEDNSLQSPPRAGRGTGGRHEQPRAMAGHALLSLTPEGPLLPQWAEGERQQGSFSGNLVASPVLEERRVVSGTAPSSYSFGVAGAYAPRAPVLPDSPSARSRDSCSTIQDSPSSRKVIASSRFGVLPPPKVTPAPPLPLAS